nr:ROK family protein [Legionella jordanis]
MGITMFLARRAAASPNFNFIIDTLNQYASLPGLSDCEIRLALNEEEQIRLQNHLVFSSLQFQFAPNADKNQPALILKSLKLNAKEYGLTLAIFRDQRIEQQVLIPKTLETEIINNPDDHFGLPAFCEDKELFICVEKNLGEDRKRQIIKYLEGHKNSQAILFEIDTNQPGQAWEQLIALSTEAKTRNFNRCGIFVAVGGAAIQNMVGMTARTFRRGASCMYYPLTQDDLKEAFKLNPKIQWDSKARAIPFYPATWVIIEKSLDVSLGDSKLCEHLPQSLTVKEITKALEPDNNQIVQACPEKRLLIVIDRKFYESHKEKLDDYFRHNLLLQQKTYRILFLEGGDENKNQFILKKIMDEAFTVGVDNRQGAILAFGGGVVLDAVGAAAALVDTDYIRVPTTLLAVIDAAVGIKTGINLNGKNDFGAFYKPRAVVYDQEFLKTEALRNIQSGLAEMIKIFIVTDSSSFYRLEKHFKQFLTKDFNENTSVLMSAAIYCMLHQLQPNIYEDRTLERLADFGHEIGHIFEYLSEYRLLHGEAVSLGMAVASTIAYHRQLLAKAELDNILRLLHAIGLPIADELYGQNHLGHIAEKMRDAKANKGGDSAVVAPVKVGQGSFIRDISLEELERAFSYLVDEKEQLDKDKWQEQGQQFIVDEFRPTEAQASIVFDVGGTNLRCGVYLSNGTLVYETRNPTPSIKSMPEASLKEIQRSLIGAIKQYVRQAQEKFPEEDLQQVIISFAGTLKKGVVLKSASLWGEASNVPLQDMLESAMPNLKFTLINDVIAAAWRYGTDPYYSQLNSICIFTLSTGIGAAYFSIGEQNQDKEVISIGHKKKFNEENSLQCDCGEYGHLEPYVSGRGALHQIIRMAIDATQSSQRAAFQQSFLFYPAKQKLLSLSPSKIEAILKDPYIKKILDEKGIPIAPIDEMSSYFIQGKTECSSDPELIEALACAVVMDNQLLCAAINKKDPFVEPLFQQIVEQIGEEILQIARGGTDRIILMGGFARAIKERLETALLTVCLNNKIPAKRVHSLFSWALDDDNDGILGAAYYGDQPRRLWSLFNRIIADKARLAQDKASALHEKILRKAFLCAYHFHSHRPKQASFKYRPDEPSRYFIWHPLELAGQVVRQLSPDDSELIVAAFLHDLLEYTEMEATKLQESFGLKVLNIACDLSQRRELLSMSLADLDKHGFNSTIIAKYLGWDLSLPLADEQVKAIANIATKIEHYSRLLDNPLDVRSQVLKILDNINNYSSIDRLSSSELKYRTDVELLLFKIYLDKLSIPRAIRADAYSYINKLLLTFGHADLNSEASKKKQALIERDLLQPARRKTMAVSITDSSYLYENSLSKACEQLSCAKQQNFARALKRLTDLNTLPISKNQFLQKLKGAFQAQSEEAESQNTKEGRLFEIASRLFSQLKEHYSLPGHYGRFSSNLSSAQLLSCGQTIVYCPKGKNLSVLPGQKYKDPDTGRINPLVTAMSGSKEFWLEFLEEQELDVESQNFYSENQTEIDKFLQDKQFLSYASLFYTSDRVVPFKIKLPNGRVQELCLFESNASQIVGGQFMFVAPSSMPELQTEQLVREITSISKALDHYLLTGHYSRAFEILQAKHRNLVRSLNPVKCLQRRGSTSLLSTTPSFFTEKNDAPKSPQPVSSNDLFPKSQAKMVFRNLPIRKKAAFPMKKNEHAEYLLMVATALEANYALFQNSSDTASIPEHYHFYAVNKNKFLFDGEKVQSIPLFQAKKAYGLYQSDKFMLERVEWQGACYRLTVHLQEHLIDYGPAVDCLQMIEGIANELISDEVSESCQLTFVANRQNHCVDLYIGIRKHFRTYPLENSLAKQNDLQYPFNGALEFAGINTMKDENEFKKYQAFYQKHVLEQGEAMAKKMLVEIQNESLRLSKPETQLLTEFETRLKQGLAQQAETTFSCS